MTRKVLSPDTVWDPGEQLLSQCVVTSNASRTLYLSGQTAITADGRFAGIDDVEAQIRLAFENIRLILAAADGTLDDVVKVTVYFVDIGNLDTYTRILGELFPQTRPAQTVVEVARLAMPELLIEIDAVAVL
ncbi:RidA family protein [Rhodococcus sp. BP-252]|uniref:Enamine deaminase RidA, house cleaning of reactive enamine intermediates, YjgF/YER057c/UK114 family n=1 Tax=Rhodococcoides kyotonense TaxID=398843 RepID=A0A177YA88_9NOCA|nr:RidA family protein [Rhodococcus sp. BP-320]MBY6418288.1 RidA family protein [Rhodococcus sp. BP-321]MBY6422702.1 RidA family protein [Rhodococcus sp. BP-324]MBY6428233.1 RidA family protein [Rhodococcus sp. BP-323]MBY6433410.1 RidA family protein [Rhodococcus sp. BP-322]MBY6442339.1 RidA family protein [Rhodococcus sp. BP-319]MBY6447206.1 RidA family protein [Rhodococcus sp. BP-318]MBY6452005.1 RidA family protein [Rhodococcus sp. BP-315]MBY6456753.1 RidA family protein [Rhodococcus sp.